jgi:small subunit ribosomal protein S8
MLSDPIGDMLTRIRNANMARHTTVDMPSSKMKEAIAGILVKEGYVKGFEVLPAGVKKTMRITLKYGRSKAEKVIAGLKRISKPGLRVYASCEELPKVLNGMGTAIVSTNKGVLTDREARAEGVGGEILAFIW